MSNLLFILGRIALKIANTTLAKDRIVAILASELLDGLKDQSDAKAARTSRHIKEIAGVLDTVKYQPKTKEALVAEAALNAWKQGKATPK